MAHNRKESFCIIRSYIKLLRGVCFVICIVLTFASCQTKKENIYNNLTNEEKRSPENALIGLENGESLESSLFASEPMLVNPTNMDIDARGRIWVTEGVNYQLSSNPSQSSKEEGDRIVILEDSNGDGKADSRKVFYQGNDINSALGIMVLDNKVIVSRNPNIFIFTDTDGDDKADKKEILFTDREAGDHGLHAFVFGPDGKLYFSSGNAMEAIKDAKGNIIKDVFGNEVKADGNPYRQGMVFRSNIDGSEFEVLGHNFRNNYEVAVDSYGSLWQSDNDDDGFESTRINYVMEYGNYGYVDELTGASWQNRRTGMAENIPSRHWHQNDPGVVPNLLHTGAGSPAGIVFYEGNLLPKIYQETIINADAGPGVVRAYSITTNRAGYKATSKSILERGKDQWFRPVDVTVAPDGSIFVADWYDPVVGANQLGDQQKGRIYRIAPENTSYEVPEMNFDTPQTAVEILKNPNLSARAKAWIKLYELGTEAEPALKKLWNSNENDRYRARALWLLSKIKSKGEHYIQQALQDSNSDIRITGLRAARQLDINIIPYLQELAKDTSPQVRREVAIALHRNESPKASEIWVQLAIQHSGEDRWYLEALGIGGAGQWERFFESWLDKVGDDWNTAAGKDIVWRARTEKAINKLVNLIEDPAISQNNSLRYFRAFDFHDSSAVKQKALIDLLDSDTQQWMRALALKHIDKSAYKHSPIVRQAVKQTLNNAKGTQEFVDLIDNFGLEDYNAQLLDIVLAHPDSSLGLHAGELLLEYDGESRIKQVLDRGELEYAEGVMEVLGRISNSSSIKLLESVILDESKSLEIREEAIKSITIGLSGEFRFTELVEGGLIVEPLKKTTAEVLSDSRWEHVRLTVREYLDVESDQETVNFASINELILENGNIENGQKVFEKSCQTCHRINNIGTEYGPGLSNIGNKLPKEGLYRSILYPNEGISLGYEGYIISLRDGSRTAGIIQSETETELVLSMPGGYTTTYDKSEIGNREQMEMSLMPSNLAQSMTQQELVDLVEYLSTLTGASADAN